MTDSILIGKNLQLGSICLPLNTANRHGLITGATGTGKTVTLQTLAEQFVSNGVPVFVTDIKSDLSGLAAAGILGGKIAERWNQLNLEDYNPKANPCEFWDVFGLSGVPLRATISEMGPLLLGRALDLNDTQSAVLYAIFEIADDQSLALIDLKDLTALINWTSENLADLKVNYGNIAKASLGAIQRSIIQLQSQGADKFFGEPAVIINEFIGSSINAEAKIHILDATKLLQSPKLYSTTLLYLLSELYENLPEVGDIDKPKLVFFFDEAHLLFDDAPEVLTDKIEQIIRLIRSKGVGVFFVTQNPSDVPEKVLSQLGTRIQHALRAYTPKEQKNVRTAAETFRPNPNVDCEKRITELGVGEALVSVLDASGIPTPVEEVKIKPPCSQIGPIDPSLKQQIILASQNEKKYRISVDSESAFEKLQTRKNQMFSGGSISETIKKNSASFGKSVLSSAIRSIAGRVGRALVRGILGSIKLGR